MKRTYYKDKQENPWVLIESNGNTVLVKATAMDAVILTKNKDILWKMKVLKRVRNKPAMPNVVATIFTTEKGNKYVKTAVGDKTICFVMGSKDNVLKAVNTFEYEDAYEKCQLANFKPADISITLVVDAVFKRKEYMAAVAAA